MLFKLSHYFVVIFGLMRKGAESAVLYAFAVSLYEGRTAGAVGADIKRAVAEKAVEIFNALMAGEIFAVPVFKKSAAVFHTKAPSEVSMQSVSLPFLS